MPWSELISENIVFPLSAYEWNVLQTAYGGVGEGTNFQKMGECDYPLLRLIQKEGGEFLVDTSPRQSYSTVCPDCYPILQERRSIYVGARISIRLIGDPTEIADFPQPQEIPNKSVELPVSCVVCHSNFIFHKHLFQFKQ